jgi:hypothetical protein
VAARLTAGEARRLGITPPIPTRTTRKQATGNYHTRCTKCGTEFTTQAGEDRHVTNPGHHRYELVL